MSNVYVFDHPLIQHKTAMIRKEDTSVKDFRELVREISMLMGYEATRKLPLEEVEITTPICDTKVNMLKGEDIAIVPILRAGLGMVDGMLALVPNAKVGHVGLYRDPETHEPVEYYCKEDHFHVPDRCSGRYRSAAEGSSGCRYLHCCKG